MAYNSFRNGGPPGPPRGSRFGPGGMGGRGGHFMGGPGGHHMGGDAGGHPMEAEYNAFADAAGLHSEPVGKPMDFCKVCEVQLFSKEQMDSHYAGKRHLRAAKFELHMSQLEENKKKGLTFLTKVPTQPPRSREDQWLDLVEWIKVANVPLLGMEHIIEVHRFRGQGINYYVCDLCYTAQMPVFVHLLSRVHIINYLNEHMDEIKTTLDKMRLNPMERDLLNKLMQRKGRPVPRTGQSPMQDQYELLVKVSNFIMTKCGRKRARIISEAKPSGLEPMRQPALVVQIKGHTTESYPRETMDKLYQYGNFSLDEEGGRGANVPLDYEYGMAETELEFMVPPQRHERPPIGGPAPGLMAEPKAAINMGMGMGMARARAGSAGRVDTPAVAPKKLSLLDWLHKTGVKLDAETMQPGDLELAEEVAALLKCGIDIYNNAPPRTDICYYPGVIDPSTKSLTEWLTITVKFFNTAWLCSEREVNMARVTTSMIESLTKPQTAGSKPDPYDAVDPYAQQVPEEPAFEEEFPAVDPYEEVGQFGQPGGPEAFPGYQRQEPGFGPMRGRGAPNGRARGRPSPMGGPGGPMGPPAGRGARGKPFMRGGPGPARGGRIGFPI